jgi:hypothetical protein
MFGVWSTLHMQSVRYRAILVPCHPTFGFQTVTSGCMRVVGAQCFTFHVGMTSPSSVQLELIPWISTRNHHIIKSSFPTSWRYQPLANVTDWTAHFNAQFSTNGTTDTIDYVPYLTVTEALRFREEIGGEKAITSYCHFLALHGGRLAAEVLGTRVMDEDGSLTANMVCLNASFPFAMTRADPSQVNILLPLPVHPKSTRDELSARAECFKLRGIEDNMAIQTLVHDGKWWWRASAQIWNEVCFGTFL